MSQDRIIYLAGLMDGEGTFSIQVNRRFYKGTPSVHFTPRMTMTLKYGTETLNMLVEEFGGKIYDYPEEKKWSLGTVQSLKEATIKLLPYLTIKKRIAERFLEALEVFPNHRTGNSFKGERSWTEEMSRKVGEIALTLNPYKKSPKTLEYLKELDIIYK